MENHHYQTIKSNRYEKINLFSRNIICIKYSKCSNNRNKINRTTPFGNRRKIAIKNVVDVFSNLADTKEIEKQVLLFTEDGIVESYSNGVASSTLKGRNQLKEAFTAFLSSFRTVYHQNSQQTIDLRGDEATATSYCRVILVGEQEGKQVKTTLYTIYTDEFVKIDNKWLIKHRKSNFVWREVEEVK